jgi:transcriptional regulator with XRE-family HTH domain
MIKNSRQASVSKRTREELLRSAEEAPPERRVGFLELAAEIGQDLEEYEALLAGMINLFNVDGIDDLGECLIKARLARGWTQRQLAEALQVSEQMVQRDEARSYEHAGLARIAEVADVLGYNLVGTLQPSHLPMEMWRSVAATAASVSVIVNIEFKTTATWVSPANRVPVNLTTEPVSSVQSMNYGNVLEQPPSYWASGLMPTGLISSNVIGTDPTTEAFDSAATVPIQLVGGRP